MKTDRFWMRGGPDRLYLRRDMPPGCGCGPWLRPWPVRRGLHSLQCRFVMVVRNEEHVLREKLPNLLELDYPEDRRRSGACLRRVDGPYGGNSARACARFAGADVLKQLSQGKACGPESMALHWRRGKS